MRPCVLVSLTLLVLFLASLPTLVLSVQTRDVKSLLTQLPPPGKPCPSLFVAVFTRRGDFQRRQLVREMWKDASESYGKLLAKFVVCKPPLNEHQDLGPNLSEEHDAFDDTLFLDCDEGYLNGTLTEKVLSSMQRYLASYSEFDLFMKTDDDTFIIPSRLCYRFQYRENHGKSNSQIYMGVFAEEGETMNHGNPPCRDPASQFYEPFSKISKEGPPWNGNQTDRLWPVSAKGGPGYILSRKVVSDIVQQEIATNNMCNNEDKCVAVWVDKLNQSGTQVERVNLPGTDGYHEWHEQIIETGKLSDYPYTLHHHLKATTIKCLDKLLKDGNTEATIDHCFKSGS